ncbi:MAG: hypothetical protein O7J95_14315, partial [Planctomycetota bacterium]|nr:hypothetical protein [Planctomycetota bacterium]
MLELSVPADERGRQEARSYGLRDREALRRAFAKASLHGFGGGGAARGLTIEELHHQIRKGAGARGVADRRRPWCDASRQDIDDRVVWRITREEVIEESADRVEVRALVDLFGLALLGRGPRCRSDEAAGEGGA